MVSLTNNVGIAETVFKGKCLMLFDFPILFQPSRCEQHSCPPRFVAASHRNTGCKWYTSHLRAIWSDLYLSFHGCARPSLAGLSFELESTETDIKHFWKYALTPSHAPFESSAAHRPRFLKPTFFFLFHSDNKSAKYEMKDVFSKTPCRVSGG